MRQLLANCTPRSRSGTKPDGCARSTNRRAAADWCLSNPSGGRNFPARILSQGDWLISPQASSNTGVPLSWGMMRNAIFLLIVPSTRKRVRRSRNWSAVSASGQSPWSRSE